MITQREADEARLFESLKWARWRLLEGMPLKGLPTGHVWFPVDNSNFYEVRHGPAPDELPEHLRDLALEVTCDVTQPLASYVRPGGRLDEEVDTLLVGTREKLTREVVAGLRARVLMEFCKRAVAEL